jgi:hypothetical protein
MALLTQNPLPGQNAGVPQQDPALAGQAPEAPEQAETQGQGLTFTTEQLVDSFKEHMDGEQAKDMGLVIDEGKQLLFGPDSHSKIMGMLEGSQNIGQDLGNGAFDAMNLVLQSMAKEKPNEEIDGKSILPAGVVLISMTLEFINESGMAPVDDEVFEDASHIFSTRMMGTYDQEFKDKAAQYQTQQPAGGQPPVDPAMAPQTQGGM